MAEFYRYPHARLLVFSRAPEAGASKTRLIPALGAAGAAMLQARLLCRTVELAVASQLAPVELWCAPESTHPLFQQLTAKHPIVAFAQKEGDLGMRMAAAFAQAQNEADTALLIGTDCPALTVRHLTSCFEALDAGQDAVLIPAEDGGYVAIGLRRPAAWLFEGIVWGTECVAEQTRERLRAHGWSWREPAQLWDVDDAADLARLRREFPELTGAES